MKMPKTVFVGLSGGVDSAVAALRLKNEGYNVVGVFIKVWHPEFLECDWEAERLDAMRVAAHLDIPFLMCDAEEAYKNEVADYFIAEYKAGRTPNPDVMCNKAVKFGAFLEFALKHGADHIATGHYARRRTSDGSTAPIFSLHRGIDGNKDQTYFLWTLTQEQLAHTLLPVGNTTKSEIRAEAEHAAIPVAAKKDSQGICFLGHIDIADFLSHYISLEQGDVLDSDGNVIGSHNGAFVYTIGQRHGFSILNQSTAQVPYYIVDKDVSKNTLIVSTNKPISDADSTLKLINCNWIGYNPKQGDSVEFQTRYRQTAMTGRVAYVDEKDIVLSVDDTHETPSIGQSCVLYEGDRCLGGGIIA